MRFWNIFRRDGLTKKDRADIKEWEKLALKLVRDMDRTSLINEAKKNETFKALKEAAISKGKALTENKINFLIERAILIMKNNIKSRSGGIFTTYVKC